MNELNFIYFFIGAHQDKSKIKTLVHSTGAVAVIVFGIIYLRARRIDYMQQIANTGVSERGQPSERISRNLKASDNDQSPFLPENDDFNDDSLVGQDDEQFFLWRIYDRIIDVFTSEFVVLNLCRLGL